MTSTLAKPLVSAPKPASGVRPPPKPASLTFSRALFAFTATDAEELSFAEGDLLFIVDDKSDPDWWRARCRGKEGMVPANYMSRPSGSESSSVEMSPLHDACRRGNMDLLEECLENRVPVNAKDKAGNTPLHWSAHSGHLECLTRLLSVPQVQVSPRNRLGDTPLHQAAWKGHAHCVKALRTAGADPKTKNGDGKTALDVATEAETRAELSKWTASLREGNEDDVVDAGGDYHKDDYAESDPEDNE